MAPSGKAHACGQNFVAVESCGCEPRNPTQAIGVSFFFVSFNLVNGIVLINVAIAVLLEKMVDDEGDKHQPVVTQDACNMWGGKRQRVAP